MHRPRPGTRVRARALAVALLFASSLAGSAEPARATTPDRADTYFTY